MLFRSLATALTDEPVQASVGGVPIRVPPCAQMDDNTDMPVCADTAEHHTCTVRSRHGLHRHLDSADTVLCGSHIRHTHPRLLRVHESERVQRYGLSVQ